MSFCCGLEWVVCLGCSRWAWKRLTYIGSYDSESWSNATADEFEPIPRLCRVILAIYEPDLAQPKYPPPRPDGYGMNADWLVKRVTYEQTEGQCPPYIIYADHAHKEIILAVCGLNLGRECDYKMLFDNRLGMQMFDGGFVHCGLLKAAIWVLNREAETLRELLRANGPEYKLVFVGHSLGSGVAALMTVIVVNHRKQFGGIAREKVRGYAIAPVRCISMNLAVKYADVIYSVVLQDDFLPRTPTPLEHIFGSFLPRIPTPLEHIFGSIFCLPCLIFVVCLRDTFIPESRKLKDPRRLYAPGRMYHIVERKLCRCGRYPPEVRTAIPVEGRFEQVVLSCTATSDHGLISIEREATKALDIMRESSEPTTPPVQQKMERKQSLEKEYIEALERAVILNVPHAVVPPEEATAEASLESSEETSNAPERSQGKAASRSDSKSSGRTNWQELVERLFNRDESGNLVLKKDMSVAE